MRLKRTRRGKTFVDITPVGEKVRITMGYADQNGVGNKNTDLDMYELDQLVTMLAYYKLQVEGKLPVESEEPKISYQTNPKAGSMRTEIFKLISPESNWVRVVCQGLCDWGDAHADRGTATDIFGQTIDGKWYTYRRGTNFGDWVESFDPHTIPNAVITKYPY